ncbi:MAG: RHS repeat protein [Eubacterium sp.]|nr:RHS repeat protein [Eubacterium sp.]
MRVEYSKDYDNNGTGFLTSPITTTFTYDYYWRVLTETVGTKTTEYEYDDNGNLKSYTTDDTESNSSYTYDSNNRVVREKVGNDYTYYTYDSNGNVLVSATLKEDYEGVIPTTYDSSLTCFDTMVYTYDSSGRVLTETNSNGESSSYVYDSVGNVAQETVTRRTVDNMVFYKHLQKPLLKEPEFQL